MTLKMMENGLTNGKRETNEDYNQLRSSRRVNPTKILQAMIKTHQIEVQALFPSWLVHSKLRVNVRMVHLTTVKNTPDNSC